MREYALEIKSLKENICIMYETEGINKCKGLKFIFIPAELSKCRSDAKLKYSFKTFWSFVYSLPSLKDV